MADLVLYPIHAAEIEVTLQRHERDPAMLEVMRHAFATQRSLDDDIKAWKRPVTGDLRQTIAWLEEMGARNPTPYDYRRHARAHAAGLLFKVTDRLPYQMATRLINEDKWSNAERLIYWKCVAICSRVWEPAQ